MKEGCLPTPSSGSQGQLPLPKRGQGVYNTEIMREVRAESPKPLPSKSCYKEKPPQLQILGRGTILAFSLKVGGLPLLQQKIGR